jgi:hypothetical protein
VRLPTALHSYLPERLRELRPSGRPVAGSS